MKIRFTADFNGIKKDTEVKISDKYGKELIEKKVAEKVTEKK